MERPYYRLVAPLLRSFCRLERADIEGAGENRVDPDVQQMYGLALLRLASYNRPSARAQHAAASAFLQFVPLPGSAEMVCACLDRSRPGDLYYMRRAELNFLVACYFCWSATHANEGDGTCLDPFRVVRDDSAAVEELAAAMQREGPLPAGAEGVAAFAAQHPAVSVCLGALAAADALPEAWLGIRFRDREWQQKVAASGFPLGSYECYVTRKRNELVMALVVEDVEELGVPLIREHAWLRRAESDARHTRQLLIYRGLGMYTALGSSMLAYKAVVGALLHTFSTSELANLASECCIEMNYVSSGPHYGNYSDAREATVHYLAWVVYAEARRMYLEGGWDARRIPGANMKPDESVCALARQKSPYLTRFDIEDTPVVEELLQLPPGVEPVDRPDRGRPRPWVRRREGPGVRPGTGLGNGGGRRAVELTARRSSQSIFIPSSDSDSDSDRAMD